MKNITNIAKEAYSMFYKRVDHRTDGWILMGSPWASIAIIALYFYMTKSAGPRFMRKRDAFSLDYVLKAYYILQILACAYLANSLLSAGWGWHYKIFCEPVDYSMKPMALKHARAVYFYYILKIVDLLDTMFLILRKKYRKVTWLHLYQHAGMVMIGWIWARYFAGGHGTLTVLFNCLAQMCMYLHYLMTSLRPKLKENMWWKKYLQRLYVFQFVLLLLHGSTVFLVRNCKYSRIATIILLFQNGILLLFFINYLWQDRIKKKKFY
ncbi:hypothetical protein L9F63_010598, partial [Diploptera punctata]